MPEIKLQYSIICEYDKKNDFRNIIYGLKPGFINKLYVVNNWIWDDHEIAVSVGDDSCYQMTEIIKDDEIIARTESGIFKVKLSHTHHNCFRNLKFNKEANYRVRVRLYNNKGKEIESGSIEYPLFVKD